MSSAADDAAEVVVVGAGHNALVCAAYLAEAGLSVCVLEARDVIGGNTVTEELTLPGFRHDSCSSAHVIVQSNPLLRDDELGLQSRYGLQYLRTDPAVVMPTASGGALVMHRDLDATVSEIARRSSADAQAFASLIREWESGLSQAHARWSSGLPPDGSSQDQAYEAMRRLSAQEVINARFSHPEVRDFMLWLAFATIQPWDQPGTGALPAAIAAGRLRHGWTTPVGGSGALPDALHAHLQAHGGQVHLGATVTSIGVEAGRARWVRTSDGRSFRAERAVVSSAHLARLAGMVEGVSPPADLVAAAREWEGGLSLFAVHAALRADPRWRIGPAAVPAVAGALGTARGMAAQLASFDRGVELAEDSWLLVVSSTVVDPQRAPAGAGTLKLLTVAPYTLAGGRSWSAVKDEFAAALLRRVAASVEGLDASDVLALVAESPEDLAAHNQHNMAGSCHGGRFRTGAGEVIPGWLSYRSGVPGLYLTGATTHPGGSVSGRPGRNAARVVLGDLGLDPTRVMGPV